jgi:hypothetical protein
MIRYSLRQVVRNLEYNKFVWLFITSHTLQTDKSLISDHQQLLVIALLSILFIF